MIEIPITKPMPCRIEPLNKKGSVTAIASDHLKIRPDSPLDKLPILPKHVDVYLKDYPALIITGQIEVVVDSTDWLLRAKDPTAAHKLNQLITQIRKNQHLDICSGNVEASDRFTGFAEWSFIPTAIPEIDFKDCNLAATYLKHSFSCPIMITGMTGGISEGALINERLAAIAQKYNIPMGIGSQRIALDHPEHRKMFAIKDRYPGVFLIGNLGWAQIRAKDAVSLCQKAIEMIQADALAIHFNLIQELIQTEGDRAFAGALSQLEKICRKVSVPVIAKEVGCGFSPKDAKKLFDCGVASIDVGGRGGTSWGYIEGLRSNSLKTQKLGATFRDWGIPTAYSLAAIKSAFPDSVVSATGGIRTGLDIAKAIALGAAMVGVGLPFMRAALESEHAVEEEFLTLKEGLLITMHATDSKSLSDLKKSLVRGLPLQDVKQ